MVAVNSSISSKAKVVDEQSCEGMKPNDVTHQMVAVNSLVSSEAEVDEQSS